MDDADRIEAYKNRLRRKYAGDLVGLKALADEVDNDGATDPTILTGQNFEGGGHTSQVAFDPMAKLAAIEAVIAEMDPTAPLPAPDRTYARFPAPGADSRFCNGPVV